MHEYFPHIRRVTLRLALSLHSERTRPGSGWLALGASILLAACATDGSPTDEPETGQTTASKVKTAQISPQTLRRLRGRKMQQIHDRELNAKASCTFKDVNGGKGRLDLLVTKAEVKRLSAEVGIPKHGVCRFDLPNFTQTAKYPNVELHSKASPCLIRLWEQNNGVTVAFHNCRDSCSGDAFDYLWPILVNPRNGRCA